MHAPSARVRFANSPASIMAARIGMMALGLITAPVVARSIGPDGRGITAAAIAAMGIAPVVLGAGLPMAVRRRASVGEEAATVRGARRLVLYLIAPAALLGSLGGTTLFGSLDDVARWLVFAGLTLAPAYVSLLCDQSVLIVRNEYGRVAVLQSLQPGVNAVGIVTCGLLGVLSTSWVIGCYVLSMLLAFACSLALVRVPFRGRRDSTRGLAREGIAYWGSQIGEAASNRLDQVIMVVVIGATGAGLYAIAALIAALPVAIAHSVGAVVFRRIATATGDARDQIVGTGLRSSLLMGAISASALAVAAPVAVPLVFGEAFHGAVGPTLIALAGSPAVVVGYVATVSLGAMRRGRSMALAQLAGLAVGIALLMPLGAALGAVGAACASSTGYWLAAILAIYWLGVPKGLLVLRRSDLRSAASMLVRGT